MKGYTVDAQRMIEKQEEALYEAVLAAESALASKSHDRRILYAN